MKSRFNLYARTSATTVAMRPAQPRIGTTHKYELNGTRMHDVLDGGKWITTSAVPAGDVHQRVT